MPCFRLVVSKIAFSTDPWQLTTDPWYAGLPSPLTKSRIAFITKPWKAELPVPLTCIKQDCNYHKPVVSRIALTTNP